jgi:hypothetical protein
LDCKSRCSIKIKNTNKNKIEKKDDTREGKKGSIQAAGTTESFWRSNMIWKSASVRGPITSGFARRKNTSENLNGNNKFKKRYSG